MPVVDCERDFASQSPLLYTGLSWEKKSLRFSAQSGAGRHVAGLGQQIWASRVIPWIADTLPNVVDRNGVTCWSNTCYDYVELLSAIERYLVWFGARSDIEVTREDIVDTKFGDERFTATARFAALIWGGAHPRLGMAQSQPIRSPLQCRLVQRTPVQ